MLEEKRRKPQQTPCPPLVSACQRARERGAGTRAQHHRHVCLQAGTRGTHVTQTLPSNLQGWFRASTGQGRRSPLGDPPSHRVCGPSPAQCLQHPPRARLAWAQPVTHQHWSGLSPLPVPSLGQTPKSSGRENWLWRSLRDQAVKY